MREGDFFKNKVAERTEEDNHLPALSRTPAQPDNTCQ